MARVHEKALKARGLSLLSPAGALAQLGALGRTPGALAIAAGDAARLGAEAPRTTPLALELAQLPLDERRVRLRKHVLAVARRVLGVPADVVLELSRPLNELGADSIMAVELRDTLARDLGLALPATLMFDHPTLDALVAHLAERLAPEATAASVRSELRTHATDEPIAVIGLGCRFPGAESPRAFWQLLATGHNAIGEVPAERWDADAWYDPDPDAPGKMYTKRGGFLDGIDRFEPSFFGIGVSEARSLDPQQRLLLEVSWEALEDAALAPDRLAGSRTGVFMGVGASNYGNQHLARGELEAVGPHAVTGTIASAAVGRISYTLGLQGPNLGLDTACSSSLVAIHLACQSLRAGESELALAGGVNVILAPEVSVMVAKARMLAADGHCKAFDASADGYVRSEGCGVVVLKRLCDAERDGDDIYAVVRGSAVNQDGRSSGLTAPSGSAQESVIRTALAQAGVAPGAISYVETHGTGTALGDPIEVQALSAVLGEGRSPAQPIVLGAVKTNVGHTELAAGVAGFIKTVLALTHRQIPGNLHLRTPNPHIPWRDLPVALPPALAPWTAEEGSPRVAGVSSFGFSGTNAHVIVSEAPPRAPQPAAQGAHVFALSARSEEALRALAGRWAQTLRERSELDLASVCETARAGRAQLVHRFACVCDDVPALVAELDAFAGGATSHVLPQAAIKLALLGAADQPWRESLRAHGIVPDILCAAGDPRLADATIVLDASAGTSFEQALVRLYLHGCDVRWPARQGARRHGLPTYAWQRTRHWLPAASADNRQTGAAHSPLHTLAWQPAAALGLAAEAPRGTWLLFADRGGRVAELAALLAREGSTPVIVEPSGATLEHVMVELGGQPLAGVVHGWALDLPEPVIPTVMDDLARACGSLLDLAQTLVRRGVQVAGPTLVLTRGEARHPTARAVIGLASSMASEHPELHVVALDLDGTADGEALRTELGATGSEPRVAWAAGERHVARLAPHTLPRTRPLAIRGDAVYLVTGGTGALGLAVAEGLVARGARHLLLTSRRGLADEAARGKVAALVARGATVRVAGLDVTDGEAVGQLVRNLQKPLAGIVHAAGVLSDGLVVNQDWPAFERVLAPKVLGALNLARHAAGVDFFVLFSSIAGWLGTPGQANYAAANGFLDGLADSLGTNALSIAWGPWAGEGMAGRLDGRAQRRATERGLRALEPDEGVALFLDLAGKVHRLERSLAVVPLDLNNITLKGESVPLLRELAGAHPDAGVRGELRRALEALPSGRRAAELLAELERGLRAALGSESAVAAERGFAELGLDSLAALEVKRQLEQALDLSLPSTLLLDHPTLDALARFLLAQLWPETAIPPPLPPPPLVPHDTLEAEIEALDESELLARIASKYERWVSEE